MDDAQEFVPKWALKKARERPQLTVPQMESKLISRYKGRNCSYSYPGYDTVYGKVDDIGLEMLREPTVIIQMNNKLYTCSLESVTDCLKLLTTHE